MVTSILRLRGLLVLAFLHWSEDPTPEQWAGAIGQWTALRAEAGGNVSRIRTVVITDGGAPNARQRAQMNELFEGQLHKLVAITNSLTNPVKRGIATALGWAHPGFKAVAPEQWRLALQHVDLEGEIERLLQEFERMQSKTAPVKTLAQVVVECRAHRR